MYAKISNNQILAYPYSWEQLKFDNPYTSFPHSLTSNELLEYNVIIVETTAKPLETLNTIVVEGTPINENGNWRQTWNIYPASEEDIKQRTLLKEESIRDSRNQLLTQSDWTQVADAPVDKQAWAVYRQALRDVTSQPDFPFEVIWPSIPQ